MNKIYTEPNQCPRCGITEEDFLHTIKCPTEQATEIWEVGVRDVHKLISKNVSDTLATTIDSILTRWHDGLDITNPLPPYSPFYNLIQDQTRIGWDSFVIGRLSKEWSNATTSTDAYGNPKRWVASLIQKLALTIWNMWDHRNTIK